MRSERERVRNKGGKQNKYPALSTETWAAEKYLNSPYNMCLNTKCILQHKQYPGRLFMFIMNTLCQYTFIKICVNTL